MVWVPSHEVLTPGEKPVSFAPTMGGPHELRACLMLDGNRQDVMGGTWDTAWTNYSYGVGQGGSDVQFTNVQDAKLAIPLVSWMVVSMPSMVRPRSIYALLNRHRLPSVILCR